MDQHQIRHIGYHNYNKSHNNNNLYPSQNFNKNNKEESNTLKRKEKINKLLNNIDNNIKFFNTYSVRNNTNSFKNDTIEYFSYKQNQKLKNNNYILKEKISELEEKFKNTNENNQDKLTFEENKNKELKNINFNLKQDYYYYIQEYKNPNKNDKLYIRKDKIVSTIKNLKSNFKKFIQLIQSNSQPHINNKNINNYSKINYKESSKNDENDNYNDIDEEINFTVGDNLYTTTEENERSNQIQIPLKQFEVPSTKNTPVISNQNVEKSYSSNINNNTNNNSNNIYTNNSSSNNKINENRKNIKSGHFNLSKIPGIIQNLTLKKNLNFSQNNKSNNRNNNSNRKITKKI
jgi:hypothetical protein